MGDSGEEKSSSKAPKGGQMGNESKIKRDFKPISWAHARNAPCPWGNPDLEPLGGTGRRLERFPDTRKGVLGCGDAS